MTVDDIRAFDAILQASGAALSANKLVDRFGGSKRDALKLMRLYRAETSPPPHASGPPTAAAPVPPALPPAPVDAPDTPAAVVEPPPAPLPLLVLAAQALRQAQAAERAARGAREQAGSGVTWDDVARCARATRQRQGELDQLHRALPALDQGLADDARRVIELEGARAGVQEAYRNRMRRLDNDLAEARRSLQARQAQRLALVGPGALPPEAGA